jgi:hypothetical protein
VREGVAYGAYALFRDKNKLDRFSQDIFHICELNIVVCLDL